MTRTQIHLDKLSIYIPQGRREEQLIERLQKIAKKQERSVNYLIIKTMLEFIEREERNLKAK